MRSSKFWLILLDLLLITIFSCVIILPLLAGNIILRINDLDFHYPAAVEFSHSIQEGYFYPRWMPRANLGLGQPIFLYYPPLLFYITAIINLFLEDVWLSLKISLFLFTWLTGMVTYMLLRGSIGRLWALIGAIIIVLFPTFFIFLHYDKELAWYASCAAGIAVIYLSIDNSQHSLARYLLLSIAVAALVLTHSLSAFLLLLCLLFVPVIDVLYRKDKFPELGKQALYWCCAVTLGVGIGLIHLMPAFLGWDLITSQHYAALNWRNRFVFPTITYFIFGEHWFLYQLYIPLILLLSNLTVTLYLIRHPNHSINQWLICMKLAFIGWLALLFGSELFYPLWYFSNPIMQKVQFPLRFLYVASLAIPLATILAAYQSWHYKASKFWRISLITALVTPVLLTTVLLLKLIIIDGKVFIMTPDFLAGNFANPGLNPATLGKDWRRYIEQGGIIGDCQRKSLNCQILLSKSQDREWLIESDHVDSLILPVPVFPGWQILLNGSQIQTDIDIPTGLIQAPVIPGKNLVRLTWKGIPSEHLGTLLSVISTGILALLFIIAIWRKRTSALFNYAGKCPGNRSGSRQPDL